MTASARTRRSTPMPKIRLPDIPVRKSMPLPAVLAERKIWDCRASQLENLRDYFTCVLATIPMVLGGFFLDDLLFSLLALPALGIAWRGLEASRKSYHLTEEHLRIRSGVFRRACKELQLATVTDITLKRPVVQKLFGRGTIRVRTSDERVPSLTLFAVARPEEVHRSVWEQVVRWHQKLVDDSQ